MVLFVLPSSFIPTESTSDGFHYSPVAVSTIPSSCDCKTLSNMYIYEPFPQAWKQAEWSPQSHAEESAVIWVMRCIWGWRRSFIVMCWTPKQKYNAATSRLIFQPHCCCSSCIGLFFVHIFNFFYGLICFWLLSQLLDLDWHKNDIAFLHDQAHLWAISHCLSFLCPLHLKRSLFSFVRLIH